MQHWLSKAAVQDVAEQTFALMLALAKQLIPGHWAWRARIAV